MPQNIVLNSNQGVNLNQDLNALKTAIKTSENSTYTRAAIDSKIYNNGIHHGINPPPLSSRTKYMLWNDTSIKTRFYLQQWNGFEWILLDSKETASRTVNLNSSMTVVEIQKEIDNIGKEILIGVVITVKSAAGTYTITDNILIEGFSGAGAISIEGVTGNTTLHTTQTVVYNSIGYDKNIFVFNNNSISNIDILNFNLSYDCDTLVTSPIKITDTTGNISVKYCYIVGNSTTYGRGIFMTSSLGTASLVRNYFEQGNYAIFATTGGSVFVNDCASTGTIPNYGRSIKWGSVSSINIQAPTGSVANTTGDGILS